MKRTISVLTVIIFVSSIYMLPSLSAITLGELKPDRSDSESLKKSDDEMKKPLSDKKADKPTDEPEKRPDEVNPRLVCLLSVIMPGGGHFYLNNDVKGTGFCIAAGVGYTATGFFLIKMMLSDTGSVAYKNYLLLTGFLFFITIVIHFVGIIEAYSDADQMNKEKLFGNDENNPHTTEFVLN